jgi:hypothetical protein
LFLNCNVAVAHDRSFILLQRHILPFQWDSAAWTSGAAGFTTDVQKLAAQSGKNKNDFVALSWQVSPRLRQELETRSFTVLERLLPGPLK